MSQESSKNVGTVKNTLQPDESTTCMTVSENSSQMTVEAENPSQNVEVSFKSENDDLRNALYQEKKEIKQLKIKTNLNILKVEELKKKINQVTKDLKKAKVNKLNSKYGQTLTENKNLKNTYMKLDKALTNEKNKLEDTQIKVRNEKILRVTHERTIQRMKEQLKEKDLKQQKKDAVIHRYEIIDDDNIFVSEEDEIETEFQQLGQLAAEYVTKKVQEIGHLNYKKFRNLEIVLQRMKNAVELQQKTINNTNARCYELNNKLLGLATHEISLEEQTAESKQICENLKIKYESEIQDLKQKLIAMEDDKMKKEAEYQKFIQCKIIMDVEVNNVLSSVKRQEKMLMGFPVEPTDW